MILGHGDDSVQRNRIGLSLVLDVKPVCDRIVLLSPSRHASTNISATEIEENDLFGERVTVYYTNLNET